MNSRRKRILLWDRTPAATRDDLGLSLLRRPCPASRRGRVECGVLAFAGPSSIFATAGLPASLPAYHRLSRRKSVMK